MHLDANMKKQLLPMNSVRLLMRMFLEEMLLVNTVYIC